MNPQEITEELEHPGARNLLHSATLVRLANNGSDRFPRVIPIGFYWNGNQIVICTAATAPTVKALSSRPNVAMTIDIRDTPTDAKALLVRGLASVDIVDGVPHEYIAASTKAFVARLSPPTPDPDVGPLHVEPSTPTARRMTSVAPPLDVDY